MDQRLIISIRRAFYVYYAFLIASIGYFAYQVLYLRQYSEQTNEIGASAGTTSVVLFILTLMPGMLGRFGISHKGLLYIRQVRGNIGIAMFLEALMHYLLVKIFPMILVGTIVPLMIFEVIGFFALQITFLLALTSNKFAMRKMGKWWKKLHALTYILVWMLFGHVILQGFSPIGLLLGVVAVAEIVSLYWKQIRGVFQSKVSES